MTFVQLQIPQNAEVGDSLTITIGGQEIDIPVPEGSQPGDVLQIQVGGDGDDNGGEKEDHDKTGGKGEEKEKNIEGQNKTLGSCSNSNSSSNSSSSSRYKKGENNHNSHNSHNNHHNEEEDFKVALHESLGITLEIQCSIDLESKQNQMEKQENELNEKQNINESKESKERNDKEQQDKDKDKDKHEDEDEDETDLNDEHKSNNLKHNSSSSKSTTSSSKSTSSDGTYAMAWPAGIHLSKCISSPPFQKYTTTKKNIIELGSGSGVVGISFITTASFLLSHHKNEVKKIKLLLTDLPSAIPLIQHNVLWNRKKLSGSISSDICENINVESLIWGDSLSSSSPTSSSLTLCSMLGKTDLILASDILYNTSIETYQSLCQTISSLIQTQSHDPNNNNHTDIENTNTTQKTTSQCEILISVRWRKPEEERKFFELMESELNYEFKLLYDEIIENCEEYKCNLHWTEYGNPNCDKSNMYFTNTFVKVNGMNVALKDITEDHMDKMDEDEYQLFEARYIQIYIGKQKEKGI
jgi:predicted nicotinamide N-methyase